MPKAKDIGPLLYEKTADSVPDFWKPQIAKYIASADLQLTYSKQELNKTLNWIVGEWRLELANEDWAFIYSSQGNWGVLRKLQELEERTWEGARYWVEKDFGYEDSGEQRPESQGASIAAKLWEVAYTRPRDRMFEQMGQDLRASEFSKSKSIAHRFTHDIFTWVRVELSKAGY